MNKEKPFDLQDRLVGYAVRIIKLSEALPDTKAGKHIFSSQILRSGTSPAPNYGEVQSALLFTSVETVKKSKGR